MVDTNIDIYSARLTFKRNLKIVIVDIYYHKKGERKRKKLSIPESINLDELNWVRYRKEIISIYHRIIKGNDLSYKDQKHTIAPTSLGQRLEELVSDAYYIYFKPTKQEPKPVITS